MEVIVGIIAVLAILIVIGKIKGAPEPSSMSIDALLGRMQSEEAWIKKYNALPYENRQSAGLKKQYEDKNLYVMQLQLELMKRSTNKDQETLIPILQRAIELIRNGMSEEAARTQATNEYVQQRDTKGSQQQEETS